MPTQKVIVLGGGLIGGVMAKYFAEDKDFQVTVADISKEKVNKLAEEAEIKGVVTDLSDSKAIKKIVADQDIVIGAVPHFLGFNMLRSVIEAGKNIVDISSSTVMPENNLTLDELAKKNGVTAVVGMGLAPGMSNMIVGYVDSLLDETENVLILVAGGIPIVREWPYEYKITWSPIDVLEEYVDPARVVECGKVIEKPALSDLELVNFSKIGTLEAFNTDGLDSLPYTIKASSMKEKTLRYPGHAEKMRILRESGFFSDKPIEIGGVKVKPIDFTAKLLFPKWEMKEGEEELSVMRIIVEGRKGQKRLRYSYELLDYFDKETKTTSQSRLTGFPCAIAARLIAQGEYTRQGVCPGEYIGQDHKVYQRMMEELEKKNIVYEKNVVEV